MVEARLPIHPSLAFRAPYFQRVTDRVIFQMTSGQTMIEWFDATFDVRTAVLFRHPIACAQSIIKSSRTQRHDCEDFLLHRWFADTYVDGPRMDLARRILAGPDPVAHHVLDWTLKLLVPFQAVTSQPRPTWTVLTYEQMVTEPNRVLTALSTGLDLPDVEAMRSQLERPSRTVSQGTVEHVRDPAYLLGRWRRDVPSERERELLEIPRAFGIDLYEAGRDAADARFHV